MQMYMYLCIRIYMYIYMKQTCHSRTIELLYENPLALIQVRSLYGKERYREKKCTEGREG